MGDEWQAAGAVATAASGLEAYLTSFVSNEAFNASASALAKRASEGAKSEAVAKGWLAEYNRLIGEVQSVFTKDPHVQALSGLQWGESRSQAAGAVATAALGLEVYLTSFVSNEAFNASASALAKRAMEKSNNTPNYYAWDAIAKGFIAEYNRMVQEAKAALAKDPHIQALKELTYMGDEWQAAGAVATAAGKLRRVMENIKETPRQVVAGDVVATVTTPNFALLQYLPYSGRFSPDAHKLAKLLGRAFSPNAKDENGWTDLHYAAVLNLPGLASALLEAGADPNAKSKSDGEAYSDRSKSILSQFGISAEEWTRGGTGPLFGAAWVNAHSVAANLIVHGAKINAKDSKYASTPLHSAAFRNAFSVAEVLIGQGADIHAEMSAGGTPLDAAIGGKAAETEALLRRHGEE